MEDLQMSLLIRRLYSVSLIRVVSGLFQPRMCIEICAHLAKIPFVRSGPDAGQEDLAHNIHSNHLKKEFTRVEARTLGDRMSCSIAY